VGDGAALSTARPGWDLRGGLRGAGEGNGHQTGARGAPVALAASLHRAGDRHHRAGVPRSRDRMERSRLVSTTAKILQTIIIGVARTWDWRRTRPSHAPSKDQTPGGSWRSPRWAGSIIGTNVAPPERTDVELSPSSKLLYCRFLGRAVSPPRDGPIPETQTDNQVASLIRVCVNERRSPQGP
jgi:hypothetical protein